RDPTANEPDRINLVRDLRRRGGQVVLHSDIQVSFQVTSTTGVTSIPVGTTLLGSTTSSSYFVCIFNGTINPSTAGMIIQLDMVFSTNDMTDPLKSSTGSVGTFSTTITCESANTKPRTAVVTAGGTSIDQLLFPELVAASAFF